jgi:hypothetical protein
MAVVCFDAMVSDPQSLSAPREALAGRWGIADDFWRITIADSPAPQRKSSAYPDQAPG